MPSQTEWDRRYLRLAREIASWSRDVSTKVGAILVDAQHIAVATGHNGFVSGLRDTPERLNNRETRLKLSLHAGFAAFSALLLWPSYLGMLSLLLLAVGVAWSRLVLSRHTPQEVALGLLAGATAGLAFNVLAG